VLRFHACHMLRPSLIFPAVLQSFRTLAASHIGGFLNYIRHMVGLLGREISPSQGLYLHRTTQHRMTRDKNPYLERDSNQRSQQPTGQDPRLTARPLWPASYLVVYKLWSSSLRNCLKPPVLSPRLFSNILLRILFSNTLYVLPLMNTN
jgi:hypothetical protein